MQLELLKLFSRDIEDKDVKEIKRLIVKYLATKLTDAVDKVWEEKGWTNEDMDKFSNTHMRTPYTDRNKH
jgi:hypothetical protein